MHLVFLYGPPGVGKLTVARQLATRTGFRLFHNHLSVNLVTSLFPRGHPSFSRLLRQIRHDLFAEAAREHVDVIFTNVYYDRPPELAARLRMIQPILEHGGKVLFVRLVCDLDVWRQRIVEESRQHEHKLTDPDTAMSLFEKNNPFPVMPVRPQVTIDTTHLSPAAVADAIMSHYGLPTVSDDLRAT
ncbi:MAG: AAA family ATPase [Chloroflexota bacterium]